MDIRSNTSVPSFSSEDKQRVVCIHCHHPNEISRRAISVTCQSCRKSLRLDEVRIKDYQARRIVESCSTVTVERKGDLRAEKILCAGAILRGKTKGEVLSTGPVLIGPEAEHIGGVTAPSIAIPSGAILEGFYRIGPTPAATTAPTIVAVPPATAA